MTTGGPRVVALVAARDRADTVAATVAALDRLPEVDEVLVVDDGSADATAGAAAGAGAWVLRLAQNRGKGGAVAAGVAATSETDVYLLVDADVGATAGAAGALLEPVLGGRADMTVGVLPGAGGRGGFGLVRGLAAAGIRRAAGFSPRAPLSGQRAVRGPLLRSLALAPRFGLETALTVDALAAGARVVEVPVVMDHRHTGRSPAGFAHRARQGADVARALWPRVTSPRLRRALVVAALVVALGASAWSGGRWEPDSVAPAAPAAKVLLVGVPGLGWDDVGTGAMPVLDRLAGTGALAAMSVRTRSGRPGVTEGYATLGAGSRVRAADTAAAAVTTGDDGRVAVADAAELRARAGSHVPSRPGELGTALHAAGRRTAVVGNADIAGGLSSPVSAGRVADLRPAAVALMDRQGAVDSGQVGHADLLRPDSSAPFGLRADPERMVAATRQALAGADVVLVDAGDLTRVEALEQLAPPGFAARARATALAGADDLLGRLAAEVPPSTLVLVVSVVPPDREWRLTPVVAAGAGVAPGYLHSPSTKRLGLVTLTDVAPTVLAALGADVPAALIGQPLRYHPAEPGEGLADRRARLAGLDRAAAYRERIYFPVALAFIVVQAVVYGLALVAFARRRAGGWRGRALRLLVLAFAAFPLATMLFRAVPFAPSLGGAGVAVLAAIDAAIVALAGRARRHPLSPLAWVLGATAWLIVGDLATGGRLQTASIMGYSPHTAARFYGLGNTAFAVLAGASILGAALHVEHAPRRREALVAVGAFLALVLVVDGAPSLGDDVGGILTLGPVFALTLVALAGRRVTWRAAATALAVTLVVLGLAVAVDLLRPPEARTHLGRVVADTWHRGGGGLATTLARKAEANVRVLRASVWTWTVPLIAGFMLCLLAGQRRAAELLPAGSPRRAGVVGALAAGLLGFAANDSGVIVTALVLVLVGPFLTLAALADDRPGPVLLEPAPSGPAPARAGPRAHP